ncbi:hypothetical protein IDJ75_07135 [Mucilaginibacter rigui]|uniref:Toxin-antitoxin system YwqK family antitoxin n=1 Tax=Mucilaginibacter rigui TaxID=534635 RepID=A0ABR7X376_9SPHI|nr:hypothetical protein [Mucilaginibacter rigui]MBD1385048.1 hypothetical protein [Mucilaginibacter rigui]
MLRIITCIFLSVLLTNKVSNSKEFDGSDSTLVNSIDKSAIQKKITAQASIGLLKTRLNSALERDVERPFMWDLFVSSNDTLMQFYTYKDLVIGGTNFKAFYVKVDYEDGDYQAILLVNESSASEYNSLLCYEALDSEEKYQRYSRIKQSRITIHLKKATSTKTLNYEVKKGLFLDYLSTSSVDKKWGDYQLKGLTKNHLKNGYWIEKRYDISLNKNMVEDGHYVNGQRNGEWNYSENGPVQIIKTYRDGKCMSIKYP